LKNRGVGPKEETSLKERNGNCLGASSLPPPSERLRKEGGAVWSKNGRVAKKTDFRAERVRKPRKGRRGGKKTLSGEPPQVTLIGRKIKKKKKAAQGGAEGGRREFDKTKRGTPARGQMGKKRKGAWGPSTKSRQRGGNYCMTF